MNYALRLYSKYGMALRYLVMGGLTTLINLVVYFVLTMWFGWSWFAANLVAWFLSVAFAYVTNKVAVFGSQFNSLGRALWEAVLFLGLRGASLLADTAILYVGLNLLHGGPVLVKIVDQVIVIVLNYVFSKVIFVHADHD